MAGKFALGARPGAGVAGRTLAFVHDKFDPGMVRQLTTIRDALHDDMQWCGVTQFWSNLSDIERTGLSAKAARIVLGLLGAQPSKGSGRWSNAHDDEPRRYIPTIGFSARQLPTL